MRDFCRGTKRSETKKKKKNNKFRGKKKTVDGRTQNWCKQKTEVSEISKMCSVRNSFISVACSILLLLKKQKFFEVFFCKKKPMKLWKNKKKNTQCSFSFLQKLFLVTVCQVCQVCLPSVPTIQSRPSMPSMPSKPNHEYHANHANQTC